MMFWLSTRLVPGDDLKGKSILFMYSCSIRMNCETMSQHARTLILLNHDRVLITFIYLDILTTVLFSNPTPELATPIYLSLVKSYLLWPAFLQEFEVSFCNTIAAVELSLHKCNHFHFFF